MCCFSLRPNAHLHAVSAFAATTAAVSQKFRDGWFVGGFDKSVFALHLRKLRLILCIERHVDVDTYYVYKHYTFF